MKQHLAPLLTCLALFAAASAAAEGHASCFADYKARKGPPLELHYGVIELDADLCDRRRAAQREVEARIGQDGWVLLKMMDLFVPGDTVSRRAFRKKEADAGPYFLRY